MKTRTRLGAWIGTLALLAGLAPPVEAAAKQMPITFGGYTNRTETLTNFPVLIVLSNNVGGASGFTYTDFVTTNGYDLRFVTNAADQGYSLNYEIESWDTNGASYVWVQVPTIPTNGSGAIWAKWGNTTASNQLACTTNGAVWTSGYQAVWHMQSTNAIDSSTNRYDATPVGGVAQSSGAAGSAVAFDGSSGYLQVAANDTFKGSDDVTIEFWVNPADSQVQYAEIMDYNHDTSPYKNWVVQLYSTPRNWCWGVNNAADDSWGPWNAGRVFTPAASLWTHVTLVKSGTTFIYYMNGAQLSSATHFATIDKEPRTLRIGARASAAQRYLNGLLDEIRIANVAMSSNWVWACHLNQASNTFFNTYGSVITVTPGAPAIENRQGTVEEIRRGVIRASDFVERVVPFTDAPKAYPALRDDKNNNFSLVFDWTNA